MTSLPRTSSRSPWDNRASRGVGRQVGCPAGGQVAGTEEDPLDLAAVSPGTPPAPVLRVPWSLPQLLPCHHCHADFSFLSSRTASKRGQALPDPGDCVHAALGGTGRHNPGPWLYPHMTDEYLGQLLPRIKSLTVLAVDESAWPWALCGGWPHLPHVLGGPVGLSSGHHPRSASQNHMAESQQRITSPPSTSTFPPVAECSELSQARAVGGPGFMGRDDGVTCQDRTVRPQVCGPLPRMLRAVCRYKDPDSHHPVSPLPDAGQGSGKWGGCPWGSTPCQVWAGLVCGAALCPSSPTHGHPWTPGDTLSVATINPHLAHKAAFQPRLRFTNESTIPRI